MSDNNLSDLISACEKEPIHIPGGIQPYGALLAFTPYFSKLEQASANANQFLGCDDVWSASIHSLVDGHVLQNMHEALQLGETYSAEQSGLSYVAYASGNHWVIEIEKPAPHESSLSVRSLLQTAYTSLREQRDPDSLLQSLTQLVRRISGFERVMVYQFDNDWHGQVTTESTGNRLDSMLGHHFPASDLPPQARAMYSKSPLRIIGSSRQEAISMQAAPEITQVEPVDMSSGALRAVSPIHMQYLQNLGVAASSSIGIFDEGKLWGIIACHHIDDIWLHPKKREALTLIVEFAAQRYFYLLNSATQHYQRRIHEVRDAMAQEDLQQTTNELISSHGEHWLGLLNAVGCTFVRQCEVCSVGEVLSQESLLKVLDWLDSNINRKPFWSTHNLAQSTGLNLQQADASLTGLMAVPMSVDGDKHAWLLFLRKEQVEIKRWAGKPEKHVYQGSTGDMLGPRKSFAMWQQTVEGQSIEWREEELYAARDIARDLLIVADTMQVRSLNEALEEMNKKLKYLAERDDLTGIWSRRVAELRMQDMHQAALRYQRPYTVMLLDLDKFKRINDEFGHSTGDQVLLKVCEAINTQIRDADIFARWGGEEFILIAAETRGDEADTIAERIRQAVQDITDSELPKVTVSIGIAEFDNDTAWDSVVDRADKSMYKAKQQGRNQVSR